MSRNALADKAGRLAAAMPVVVSPRAGGGAMLRKTYGGPSSEIALREAGLIWGGRLHPLKARVLLETCLRAGLDRSAITDVFDAFGSDGLSAPRASSRSEDLLTSAACAEALLRVFA